MVMRKEGLGSLLPGKGRPIRFLPTIPPEEEPRGPGGTRPPGTSLADKIRRLQMQKQRLAEQLRRIEIQLQQLMSGGERPPWDIEPPRMYKMGYTHANCGGVCVKQGWGDWVRTLINFPNRYTAVEEWEKDMRNHPQRSSYALLRDQSEYRVRPKTLEQLREEHEAKYTGNQASLFGGAVFDTESYLDELDSISACVRCGVGDYLPDPEELE